MKTIRKSVYRAQLEAQLSKYERRIQKMAENAYKVRQVIENMIRQEAQDAIHSDQREGKIGGRGTDTNSGEFDVLNTATPEAVLAEQPAELSSNIGDSGINSGSAV